MRSALVEVPPERLAGVVLLTDGQVHDVPAIESDKNLPPELGGAPVHALIAGKKNERDRLIVMEQSPRFGVVGREVTAKFRIEDPAGGTAPVTLSVGGEVVRRIDVPVGKSVELPITVGNPGANVVELEVAPGQNELTLDNNRAPVHHQRRARPAARAAGLGRALPGRAGVAEPAEERSRRRPGALHHPAHAAEGRFHAGARAQSLIVFPMRELFEQKLKEFDLIIFDRYELGSLITREYFRNIAEYVKGGGALLVSVGPVFATPRSLYRTPLGAVLPAAPLGDVLETPFKPKVTEIGQRHPVTANLPQAGDPGKEPRWGRWFRLVTSRTEHGNAILSGADEQAAGHPRPRRRRPRRRSCMSDHLWLWNRGIDGGGPQPELVRRIAHWLMKEPDLEEEALRATVGRRPHRSDPPHAGRHLPAGHDDRARRQHAARIDLRQTSPGLGLGVIDVDKPGLYRFDDGTLRTVAAVGNPDPLEFSDVRATDAKLKPLVEASGGAMHVARRQRRPRHPLGPPRPRRRRLGLDRAAPQRRLHGRRHQPAAAAARHPGGAGLPGGARQRLVARGALRQRTLYSDASACPERKGGTFDRRALTNRPSHDQSPARRARSPASSSVANNAAVATGRHRASPDRDARAVRCRRAMLPARASSERSGGCHGD